MTNIPADQPLEGSDWGVVFWSKLNTRLIGSTALNMGYMLPKFHGHIQVVDFTKDFDLTVAWFASYLPRSTTSYFMRVDWETVGRCVNRPLHDLENQSVQEDLMVWLILALMKPVIKRVTSTSQ